MRAAMSACSLWGLLVLLLAAPRGADAQLDGIGAKLAAMKERALQMNAEMGVRPTRTREDTEWEKITGRPLASLKGAEPAGQTHSCFDINARCSELVQKGQCTASTTAKWMAENCRRSCGICGTMTNAAPMKEKTVPRSVADQIKSAFGGGKPAPAAKGKSPNPSPAPAVSPPPAPAPATPKTTPNTKAAQMSRLPKTQKVKSADDFGAFGKISTDQYFGVLKKLKGTSNILPVMGDMGIETVADLAYVNVQHIGATMKLRSPLAAKSMAAELRDLEQAVIDAKAGLRKLLNPFKQKLFDKQQL